MKQFDKRVWYSIGRTILAVLVGSCLCALAANTFFIPQRMLSNGFTGLSLLLNYLLGWNVSITYFTINIPLFFLVWKCLGKRSFLLSIIGTLVFSLAVELIPSLPVGKLNPLSNIVLGGAIYGAGIGIVLRFGGLTGGTDIIARLLNKYFAVSMGATSLIFNAILFTVFSFFDGVDIAVLTLAAVFISTVVNNYVNEGIDRRRSCMIVTDKTAELAKAINTELGRGATVLDAHGAYTGKEHSALMTILSTWQVPKLRRLVQEIDPHAFMAITETVGVYGNGRGFQSMGEED